MSKMSESDSQIMKEKILHKLKWFFASFIWLGILFLVADIVSKNVVVSAYKSGALGENGAILIPGFLRVQYIVNNHFVFGMDLFKNDLATRIVFVIVALGISAGIIVFLVKKWGKVNKFYKACLMMIIAGAVGNSIDRIFFTSEYLYSPITGVVDWIDFYGVWGFHFNVADIAVVVAAIMLIVYMFVVEIIDYRKKSKLQPKTAEDNTKVVSKTEQEKNKFLEKKDNKDE